jgi:hypothetical protein
MRDVHIAVDIMAAGTAPTAIADPMGTMAMPIAPMATTAIAIGPTDITAIGDTATMVAIGGPIADTGRGVHIVDGADCRPFQHSAELMKA